MTWTSLLTTIAIFWAFWRLRKHATRSKSSDRQPRKIITLPMLLESPYKQVFSVSTYDISMTGAFIGFEDIQQTMNQTAIHGRRTGIKVGDRIQVTIYASRFMRVYCSGDVVRWEDSHQGNYPSGIGIQFRNMSNANKNKLNSLLNSIEREDGASSSLDRAS